jgi:hypothetical protein
MMAQMIPKPGVAYRQTFSATDFPQLDLGMTRSQPMIECLAVSGRQPIQILTCHTAGVPPTGLNSGQSLMQGH